MSNKLTELSSKITQINNEQLIDLLIRTINIFNNTNKSDQLQNKELQKSILNWLEVKNKYNYIKALEFVGNNELDEFEQICRYYHKDLSELGYVLTEGKVCFYGENNLIKEEYYLTSEGLFHGENKIYSCGNLEHYQKWDNGVLVKVFLKKGISQLENQELVNSIFEFLSEHYLVEALIFKKHIDNKDYESAEQICRWHHFQFDDYKIKYKLTPGKVCYYFNYPEKEEYYIDSEGKRYGEYKVFDEFGKLVRYYLYDNGVKVKTYLEDESFPFFNLK